MWKGREWRQCALGPTQDGPELLRLKEAGEGARGGPPQFSSHPSGGGVQPSPSKAEQAPGTRDAGVGGGGGAGTGTYGIFHHWLFTEQARNFMWNF